MNNEKMNSKIKLSHNFRYFNIRKFEIPGGDQNLERRNVERPILGNFKIANIKITKDELFDNFIFEFNFSFFRNHSNTQNI